REVEAETIPQVRLDNGATVRVISGEIAGEKGPVRDIVIDPLYLDVTVPPAAKFSHEVTKGYTVFAYVLEGDGRFEEEQDPLEYKTEGAPYFDFETRRNIGIESLVLYDDGDAVEVEAGKNGVRFLLISGKPLREPVAWYGPIVMNTREELETAFDEYRKGTFIK
ncbi:MAG: pirin family protein, partial [Deltaproteobacteria bacterium]|nr:pirin family protein [Candidatus Zymogenaceae bacterium]